MLKEQLELRGIHDPAVLRVMRETPRHLFVPPSEKKQAYADYPLSIGYGATISQPYIVALMTHLLGVGGKHTVLEIGTGSGYQAAILSQLAAHVYTIEVVPELARSARTRLENLGYRNVTVRAGNGYEGWPEHAPFDRIILTAAPPEMPPLLIEELASGGRLVAPVGSHEYQHLVVLDKDHQGNLHSRDSVSVIFVPMLSPAPE